MVDTQIRRRGVRDESVLSAMLSVPREEFVPESLHAAAYEDRPLPIEEGQTISQPYIVGLMLDALELKSTDRVLEVGSGSGYAASVMSRIAAEVYGVEWYEVLTELAVARADKLGYPNVLFSQGDGTRGWNEHAPYDAILVSAGGPEVPQSLLKQLRVGGRLVIPVGTDPSGQDLVRVRRISESEVEREFLCEVRFVPLMGSEGWGDPPKN